VYCFGMLLRAAAAHFLSEAKIASLWNDSVGNIRSLRRWHLRKASFSEARLASLLPPTPLTARSMRESARFKRNVNEINIGGRPTIDGNWKSWAETVRERPMPVRLQVKGIWEDYIDEDQTTAFVDAVLVKYGLDLSGETESNVLQVMHFGIYKPDAVPITSYSRSPSSNYRCLLGVERFECIKAVAVGLNIHEG
jgi:hypothetical protein